MPLLRVVLVKPSKYAADGAVERFRTGFMPNATLYHIAGLTPDTVDGVPVVIHTIDEYVHDTLDYLSLLRREQGVDTLVALVGVQSHQFHRALDLAAYAKNHGIEHCVIGGPHAMTCNTTELQNRGVSFALAEAELIWGSILRHAVHGELQPVYGMEHRWAERLEGPVIDPPGAEALGRYFVPMLGIYPVRGCPYRCTFCSVIKIAGRQVRSPNIETTIESLRRARAAGVKRVIFVSDNFNKFPEVEDLLQAMIDEKINIKFFCQCDTQLVRQPRLVELLGRANCWEIFVGVESFNRNILKAARKFHNHPEQYKEIIRMCDDHGIRPHFSNIIGFPDDNEHEIKHHLEVIKELQPKVASFYILTPIPGTEQYDEFRAQQMIWEHNLDRFDGTCPTWRHPKLTNERLSELLYHCYVDFYGSLLRQSRLTVENRRLAIFNRFSAGRGMHPMAGGVDKLVVDRAEDYRQLRQTFFGVELVPLPESLPLSVEDEAINRKADWKRRTENF